MIGGVVNDVFVETEPEVLDEALKRWVVQSRITAAGRAEASAAFWERLGARPVPADPDAIAELVADRLTGMQVAYLADVLRERPLTRRLRSLPDTARARRLLMRMTAGYAVGDGDVEGEPAAP